MQRVRVGIDVDDVLSNFVDRTLDIYNSTHFPIVTMEQLTEYDVYKCLPTAIADELSALFIKEELLTTVKPLPYTREAVKQLIDEGCEVFFISACDPVTHGWKCEWLLKNYPEVSVKNHIYSYHKHLLNMDFLIDDNLDHLRKGLYTRILINKPWNLNQMTGYDYRVDGLYEAVKIISDICNSQKEVSI